jgi:hypothetical protein
MKKIVSYCFILAFALLLTSGVDVYAQGPGGGPGPCTSPPCIPPNPPGLVPIDGGILFLLVSGITLGVVSLKRKQD